MITLEQVCTGVVVAFGTITLGAMLASFLRSLYLQAIPQDTTTQEDKKHVPSQEIPMPVVEARKLEKFQSMCPQCTDINDPSKLYHFDKEAGWKIDSALGIAVIPTKNDHEKMTETPSSIAVYSCKKCQAAWSLKIA